MEKNNFKVIGLLKEGISFETIKKLDESQISALYKRIINEKTSKTSFEYDLTNQSDEEEFKKDSQGKKPEQMDIDTTNKKATIKTEGEVTEKSVSKKQHGLMGAAYSVEKGEKELKDIPKSYRNKVKKVVDSMSKKQVKDFAKTKTSKLPEKVEDKDADDVKKLEESILRLVQKHTPPTLTKSELIKLISKK
jgi:NADH dehydrogenase/NADH:ubiquinone oxidoreductase subunit G